MMRAAKLGFAAVLVAGVAFGADERAEPKQSAPRPGAPVACAAAGVDVTVALAYDFVTIGHLAATYVTVGFGPPLSLPGERDALRTRLTSLLPEGTRVGPPTLDEKRLRVPLATALQAIPPGNVFKMRFDCPSGARIDPGSLSCETAEVTGPSGEPLHENLARGVRCLVGLDPAAR